jgi:hypothetical protein
MESNKTVLLQLKYQLEIALQKMIRSFLYKTKLLGKDKITTTKKKGSNKMEIEVRMRKA